MGAFRAADSLIRVTFPFPSRDEFELFRVANQELGHIIGNAHTKHDADCVWDAHLFPNLRHYHSLPLSMDEHQLLLREIITHGGRLPYNTEKWVYYTEKYTQGETMLVNEEWERVMRKNEERRQQTRLSELNKTP